MPHLPPAHHETSKRDSPHETKINVKQTNVPELITWFLIKRAENKGVLRKNRIIKLVACLGADQKSCCLLLEEKRKELELRSGILNHIFFVFWQSKIKQSSMINN
jgi:hypothetical protein